MQCWYTTFRKCERVFQKPDGPTEWTSVNRRVSVLSWYNTIPKTLSQSSADAAIPPVGETSIKALWKANPMLSLLSPILSSLEKSVTNPGYGYSLHWRCPPRRPDMYRVKSLEWEFIFNQKLLEDNSEKQKGTSEFEKIHMRGIELRGVASNDSHFTMNLDMRVWGHHNDRKGSNDRSQWQKVRKRKRVKRY